MEIETKYSLGQQVYLISPGFRNHWQIINSGKICRIVIDIWRGLDEPGIEYELITTYGPITEQYFWPSEQEAQTECNRRNNAKV